MRSTSRPVRHARAIAVAGLAATILFHPASNARAQRADSIARGDSVRRIEGVIVTALRAGDGTPATQKTIGSATLERRYVGQDVPILLQGLAPSLTAHSETGTPWGYSYFRLRGLDQSRINFTLDGIPLNDPEDQVLYFADFPDLGNSIASVQVQRGVGTSSAGTPSFAGSINLQSLPLLTSTRGTEVQFQRGSFDSHRVSVEHRTGLLRNRVAAYARLSTLRTDGFREHAGIEGRSGFLSVGYFGDRDVLKLTATAGRLRDTMAYLGATEAALRTNRRVNPLTPEERDGFAEQIVALGHTRLLSATRSIATTVYRISASGDYDVAIAPDLWNFNLDFVWYGVTSAFTAQRGPASLSVGVNANDYSRDHHVYIRPDLASPLYFNTGHKRDASMFVKGTVGTRVTSLFADVQLRHATFRYEPDAAAGIAERSVDWTFVNPKVGLVHHVATGWSVYGSYGTTGREPARNDMFGGFDNLDTTNAAFVGPLTRVRPERVHDVEAGATWRGRRGIATANLFWMRFRNEIAPIGTLSYIGLPLRQNVASSARRGIELDAELQLRPSLTAAATAALAHNRIREFVDSTGATPRTFRDVPPALSPAVITSHRLLWAPGGTLELGVEGRYQSRSYLDNTGTDALALPAFHTTAASAVLRRGSHALTVRVENLTDELTFASGHVSAGEAAYFVLPPRSVYATLRLAFGGAR